MAKSVRLLLAGLALAASMSAPALAEENNGLAEENRAAKVADRLNDPITQYMVAGLRAAISKQVLETRAEPLVRMAEAAGGGGAVPDLPPDATLGDLAGPEAERLPGQIMQRVPKLMGSLAEMASAYESMQPELRAMAKRMKDAIPRR